MNELIIEEREMISGGCSFDEMMYYSLGQSYHLHGLGGSGAAYRFVGVVHYLRKLVGCI